MHRDIAARNVLLDANENCKLADFGLSVALGSIGKDYARLLEQLPIRHAAIEVLETGRFSAQSDTWSFGCLAWELFSVGADPYDGMATLTEVASHVKSGGQLEVPLVHPADVHSRLKMPCWAGTPSDRPSFVALFSTAVELGAIPDPRPGLRCSYR